MKYKDLNSEPKRSINGSIFSQFQSGCLDFKGEEAFFIWTHVKFYKKDNGHYYRGYRDNHDSYLDNEQFEELKAKFTERYNNRMKILYWCSLRT